MARELDINDPHEALLDFKRQRDAYEAQLRDLLAALSAWRARWRSARDERGALEQENQRLREQLAQREEDIAKKLVEENFDLYKWATVPLGEEVQRLRAALERIRDRAQRILEGEVVTESIGAADYDVQVVDGVLGPAARGDGA